MQNKKRERGFSILEMMVVLAIAMSLVAVTFWNLEKSHYQSTANSQGAQLLTLSNAMNTYATVEFTPLVNQQPVPGAANSLAPTVAELQKLGFLSLAFNPVSSYGGGYMTAVSLQPPTCTPPACDLATLVNLTKPLANSQSQRVDTAALGSAAESAGGNAGYSMTTSPSVISFLGGNGTVANPMGNVGGILAIRGGYGSTGMAQFTRRDGSAPPTANWNFAGYNLTNVGNLQSNTLQVTQSATVGGTLTVSGQTYTNGIANTGNITNTGNLTNQGNVTVNGTTTTNGITNTGTVTTGLLSLTTPESAGGVCPGDGYQAESGSGSLLSCIGGVWSPPVAASSTSVTTPPPPPSGCTSTVTWGGGLCSASISLSPGQSQAVTNSSGAFDPSGSGGTYAGSAQVTCASDGSGYTVSSQACTYSVTNPMVIDPEAAANGTATQPTNIMVANNALSAQSWCNAVLPESTATSYSVVQGTNAQWTCWNNNGYDCEIAWPGSAAGSNGQSCYNYDVDNFPNQCDVIGTLICTRTGS